MSRTPRIVGIGGTTRPGSSTEKAVRFSLRVCEQEGATTAYFGGTELARLPYYAPESPERNEEALRLVEELWRVDGVIIGSSSYHGTISGLVKNALDYAEDLRENDRVYFSGMPVGCIATGAGWQGIVTTLQALRSVAHALRGWPTPLGVAINTSTQIFDPEGDCSDERVKEQLTMLANEIMAFVTGRLHVPVTRERRA